MAQQGKGRGGRRWRIVAAAPVIAGTVWGLAPAAHAQAGAAEREVGIIVGQPLPGWRMGEIDIHQINTGRGEASFLILPDGTNLLVDASGKTVEEA
ncbi:MAG: hypothetical protein EOP62_19000, partial [Sphingomonadales bacterium]